METTPLKPGYFRFMTLLAFHVFLQKKVNATILEVGVGGTYDSTNLVPTPVVTGITALGLDHTTVLGKTLAEIAWHKSGIFKVALLLIRVPPLAQCPQQGVPAFSVTQPPEGMEVIERRAKELKVNSIFHAPVQAFISPRRQVSPLSRNHLRSPRCPSDLQVLIKYRTLHSQSHSPNHSCPHMAMSQQGANYLLISWRACNLPSGLGDARRFLIPRHRLRIGI